MNMRREELPEQRELEERVRYNTWLAGRGEELETDPELVEYLRQRAAKASQELLAMGPVPVSKQPRLRRFGKNMLNGSRRQNGQRA